jgi:hypothetical protein
MKTKSQSQSKSKLGLLMGGLVLTLVSLLSVRSASAAGEAALRPSVLKAVARKNVSQAEFSAAFSSASAKAKAAKRPPLKPITLNPAVIKAVAGALAQTREGALSQLNQLLGLPQGTTNALVFDSSGKLKEDDVQHTPNSQAYSEMIDIWNPAQTTLSVVTNNNSGTTQVVANLTCEPQAGCNAHSIVNHANSVSSNVIESFQCDAPDYVINIPADQADAFFNSINHVYTFLQQHPQ